MTPQPVTLCNPLMRPSESDADFARRMGYKPGTVLVGNEGFGDTYIKITAVGEKSVLAKAWTARHGHGYENLWTLAHRAWVETDCLELEGTQK